MQKQLTNAEYHACSELSSSQCKTLLDNPYKFAHRIPVEQTKPMLLGSVTHKLVFEPDDFNNEFAVSPKFDGRTTVGKNAKKDFERKYQDKIIIDNEMYTLAKKMSESVLKSPAKTFLTGGLVEQSYFGEIADIQCRCRQDYYLPNAKIMLDLKTCKDASSDIFAKDAVTYKYALQAAFYLDVMASIGKEIDRFFFVCVEPKAPFMVSMYELDSEAITLGRMQYAEAIENYKNLNQYQQPIYLENQQKRFIQLLHLPAYAYKRYNQSIMEYNYV